MNLKGEFHISVHGQTVTLAYLIPLLLKKIESTDAGNGNNVVKVKLLVGITFAIISFVL